MSNENQCVLFSQLGFTDPVRDSSEGPMLHIVRKYNPKVIYLFMTKEIHDKHKKDDRYVSSLLHQAKVLDREAPEIIIFDEGKNIDDPSDFDIFLDTFYMLLRKVLNDNQNSTVLINASSGTPQMLASLCMAAISLGGNLKLIQVKTPNKGANYPIDKYCDEDVVNVFENIGEFEDRCVETKVNDFKKSLVTSKIKELVNNFDYKGALRIVKDNGELFESDIEKILRFADKKSIWDYKNADLILDQNWFKYCPTKSKNTKSREIVEFYLTIRLEEKKKDFANMVLKLSPILTAITSDIIVNKFGYDLEKIIDSGRLSRRKLERNDPELLRYIESKSALNSNPYVNLSYLLRIVNFLIDIRGCKYEKCEEHAEYLKELREIEEKVRNEVAHEMKVNDEKLFDKVGSYKDFVAKLDRLIVSLYKNELKEGWKEIYSLINRDIIELL